MIYIVEDDASIRELEQYALQSNGYEVQGFESAEPFWQPNETGGHLNEDYFGGDLEGIRIKLPYLREMGVDYLYLNPIFEAHSNHRYNTADYLNVDPLLGTNEEFEVLCREAAKYGIGIVLDGHLPHQTSRLSQDHVAPGRSGDVCSSRPQQGNIPHDDLSADGELSRQGRCADRLLCPLQKLPNGLPPFFRAHGIPPFRHDSSIPHARQIAKKKGEHTLSFF